VTLPLASESRRTLRAELKRRRAALPPAIRAAAAESIRRHVAGGPWLITRRNIALYAARPPEVDTTALRALAHRRQCRVYLPRVIDYRQNRLRFFRDGAADRINRFGIAEPAARFPISVTALSVVFLPLLGFDARGTRLGAGKGYYDRLLAFRRHRQSWHRPLLIGLAYACQEVAAIERHPHDVPLDAVVTEAGIRFFPWSVRS
jgi:5-formyltetrahydrofolate cyclo-ligase